MSLQTNKPARQGLGVDSPASNTVSSKDPVLRSMTGYAHRSAAWQGWSIALELRCVNSRYLDLGFRLPDELRPAEPALREILGEAVKRGKLECRIQLQHRSDASRQPAVDTALLDGVLLAASKVQQQAAAGGLALNPISAGELLRWPGVLLDTAPEPEALIEQVLMLARQARSELQDSRQREAEMLGDFILQRVAQIEAIAQGLLERGPIWIQQHQEQLLKRLQDTLALASAGSGVSESETMARVRQEVLLYGIRIDVAEELGRLKTHLAEVRRVLSAGGLVGKRLDFLMQELNREANTLGSKAADIGVTQAAMECKLAIEQMREQIQNLE